MTKLFGSTQRVKQEPNWQIMVRKEGPKALIGSILLAIAIIGTLSLLKATCYGSISIGKLAHISLSGSIPLIAVGVLGLVVLLVYIVKNKRQFTADDIRLRGLFLQAEVAKSRGDEEANKEYRDAIRGILRQKKGAAYHIIYNEERIEFLDSANDGTVLGSTLFDSHGNSLLTNFPNLHAHIKWYEERDVLTLRESLGA